MEKMKFRLKQIPSLIIVSVLIAVTLFTGVSTIVKASKSVEGDETISVPEVKGDRESESMEIEVEDGDDLDVETEVKTKISGNLETSSPTPTMGITADASVSATVDTTGRCIITVFGKSYDVTPLQTSHPGGNVFVCGADNTASYQSAHGTNVSRLSSYLVTSTGTASTGTSTGTTSSSVSGTSERELEDEKREFEDALEEAKKRLEEEHEDDD